MKVEGPQKSQNTSPAKKKDKVSSGEGTFSDMVTGGTGGPSQTAATQSLNKIDALLAAQEVEDPTARAAKRRMKERGQNILAELEKLRMALLGGSLTVGLVIDIADTVAAHREKIMDPALTAILDEIDLRAQVEIAKLRMAMKNQT